MSTSLVALPVGTYPLTDSGVKLLAKEEVGVLTKVSVVYVPCLGHASSRRPPSL